MSIWAKIGLIVILLHFIIGFGWLAYKLSPKKEDKENAKKSIEESNSDEK